MKKTLGLLVAALALAAAAVTGVVLTDDTVATPQGDTTWGAPAATDAIPQDTTWG